MTESSEGSGASGFDPELRLDHILGEAFRAERAPRGRDLVGETMGAYLLLEQIGSGGMGEVYLGEQREPVVRRVAVKVLKHASDSVQLLARFRRERNALARFRHRNIATVFDAGTSPTGGPYVVMEFVPGLDIVEHCERHDVSLDDRLSLLAEVCDGIQHAHEHGVIHRDLKPSNILVTPEDGRNVPKIIDFGLASYGASPSGSDTWHTRVGTVLGTLDFMSPEQAAGTADLDTRTDIYALGVLLYELVCGERPLANLGGSDPLVAQRRILSEVPMLLSARLRLTADRNREARAGSTTSSSLSRKLRSDLDWVASKALNKDREERYGSAAELAADLRAYVKHLPVSVAAPNAVGRVVRILRRGRVYFAVLGLVLALLVGWIATTHVLAGRARAATISELEARRVAGEHLARFHQLSGIERLRMAERELSTIFPADPAHAAALRSWLDAHAVLVGAFPTELRATIAYLRAKHGIAPDRVSAGNSWPVASDRFLHDTLSGLVEDLDRFAVHAYQSARDDLAWAESVHQRSVERHREAWQTCLARTPWLPAPQLGLVPLGPDPGSGLQEFYDLRSSGDIERIPRRNAQGRIDSFPEMGVVFVLIPGGEIRGSAIQPFLLAKCELTQAQWARITHGSTPSLCPPDVQGKRDVSNPVDNVDLSTCRDVLARQGWCVPDEQVWEYACRAGRDESWPTGGSKETLVGAANLADRTAYESNKAWSHEAWLDDGYVLSAPVGRFRPNGFGLHDMVGNVAEWCETGGSKELVSRGGSYVDLVDAARSSARQIHAPGHRASTIGVRPMRTLEGR